MPKLQGSIERVVVIAPHPDDETLGAGGTLLRLVDLGVEVHWLIVTDISEEYGWNPEVVRKRKEDVRHVARAYRFQATHNLALRPARLEAMPFQDLITKIAAVVSAVRPDTIFIPERADAHSDHKIVHAAARACTKWFRFPYVRNVLAMEIISETDFGDEVFSAQVYIDISEYLAEKCRVFSIYESEAGPHPFPRSSTAIEAKASQRGYESGCKFAEAFRMIRSVW